MSLHEISFQVNRERRWHHLQEGGTQKQALGLIAGVLKPSSGNITVKGRVSPLLELGAGFNSELTGGEKEVLKGVLMGLTRAEVLRKMDE